MIETRGTLTIDMRQHEVETLRAELQSMRQQRDDWEAAYYEASRKCLSLEVAIDRLQAQYSEMSDDYTLLAFEGSEANAEELDAVQKRVDARRSTTTSSR